jgi:hypothetical protein
MTKKLWIDLLEQMDHPHLRGEDEEFSYLYGSVIFNVDLARRLIASGNIIPQDYAMPVKKAGDLFLHMNEFEFGDDGKISKMSLGGNAIDFERLDSIPSEKMAEPALMVMFLASVVQKKGYDKEVPILIDGTHRLARLYREGVDTMPTYLIREMKDVMKFATVTRDKKKFNIS